MIHGNKKYIKLKTAVKEFRVYHVSNGKPRRKWGDGSGESSLEAVAWVRNR